MPMPPYPVLCYAPGCGRPARFKVAARWSDGVTEELKTYALSCEQCLPRLFREARRRQRACRLAPGETLEAPGIFAWERGRRDGELRRCGRLEAEMLEEEG